jgi:DNA polymerase-4
MHVRGPDRMPEDTYHQVLELLAESPVVQALPPAAALVEPKGALRYHGTDTRRLGEMLRVRAVSQLGAMSAWASARPSPSQSPPPPRLADPAGS